MQQWPQGKNPGLILISSLSHSLYHIHQICQLPCPHTFWICLMFLSLPSWSSSSSILPLVTYNTLPGFWLLCTGNIEPPLIMWVLWTRTLVSMLVWWVFLSTESSPHPNPPNIMYFNSHVDDGWFYSGTFVQTHPHSRIGDERGRFHWCSLRTARGRGSKLNLF